MRIWWGNAPLQISVVEGSFTKVTGQNTGTSLPEGSEIGVFVTAGDGSSYDNMDYNNIKFTSTVTGNKQTWAYDETTPVMLSPRMANVYAYYPRQASDVSLTSVTISNDGNDWMYTPSAAVNVSMKNPTASLSMEHAMSIVRVKVVARNASSSGTISSLTVDGTGWATSATLNLQNGTIGSYVGEGTQLVANDLGALNTTGVTHEFWVVSNETASVTSFGVTVGEDLFKVKTPAAVTLGRGKVYTYVLSVENMNEASLASVSMSDWATEATQNFKTYLYTPPLTWEEAKTNGGVYGISSDGKALTYEVAMNTPESLTGVALVMNGKAFEIAKENASTGSKWAATSLTTVQQTYFSGNYITSSTTAKADMDGKGNTQRIIDAGVTIATVINDYNTSNGTAGWCLPSLGQLYEIYSNRSQINALLGMVSGTTLSTSGFFWSSSVCSAIYAWHLDFGGGHVSDRGLTNTFQVRLVRDL